MIEITKKEKCCGCHGCMNICPKNAIKMVNDENMFKYPKIDKEKCINCGLCEKVCPILNNKEDEKKDVCAYACYNKNLEERLNSSSGGLFILLAKEIIRRKGVVFGASFDNDFNIVHTYAEKEENLKQFMGSKYVQSSINKSYKKVKEFLDNERYVLFTGTPCQIEGLKSYLRKDYKKLYTQDIICHGVPSPKVWDKYIEFQKKINNNEKIKSVSFRNKDHGWTLFRTKIYFNTRTYLETHQKDLFMQAFLKNTCLRDSCYECSFKKKYRISDITLADYWGVRKVHPDMYDNRGTSLVIINSDKGRELFDNIKSNLEYKETNFNEAIELNSAMTKSANMDPNRDLFFNNLDKIEFDDLVKKYTRKTKFSTKLINKAKSIIKYIIGYN